MSGGQSHVEVEPATPSEAPHGARLVADLVDVDLTSGRTFVPGVPHDAFDVLRAAGVAWHDEQPPDADLGGDVVHFVPSPGFWAVTSHELVSEVLRNPGTFSSYLGGTTLPSMSPDSLVMFRQMMLNMDPPDHVRLRRILQPVFTPKAVGRLHEEIVVNAREIVADLPGDTTDEVDLVTAVSAEMPLRVLADLLGMPREDRHLIFQWSNALLGLDHPGGTGPGRVDEAVTAFAELTAYGQAIADARRAEPRDDIVSRIVNARVGGGGAADPVEVGGGGAADHVEVDGERLTDTEFTMFWVLLVVAGNETTRSALSGAVIALAEHDRWRWLADRVDDPAHPTLLATAVDELLRYVAPVMQFRRTATTDTVLGDQHIRAGDKVVVWYGAACRDPEVFDAPHTLDLTRDPNPHLAFGVGPHFCLGAHLARLEVAEMLRTLLRRAPDLTLAGAPTRVPSNFVNGIGRLPVHLGSPATVS